MENKGIELALNIALVKRKEFTIDLGFNYTNQSNKVLSLYLDQDVIQSNGTGNYNILRVG